ncbi:hypothetical protein BGZ94_004232, partial [Podila epigama]
MAESIPAEHPSPLRLRTTKSPFLARRSMIFEKNGSQTLEEPTQLSKPTPRPLSFHSSTEFLIKRSNYEKAAMGDNSSFSGSNGNIPATETWSRSRQPSNGRVSSLVTSFSTSSLLTASYGHHAATTFDTSRPQDKESTHMHRDYGQSQDDYLDLDLVINSPFDITIDVNNINDSSSSSDSIKRSSKKRVKKHAAKTMIPIGPIARRNFRDRRLALDEVNSINFLSLNFIPGRVNIKYDGPLGAPSLSMQFSPYSPNTPSLYKPVTPLEDGYDDDESVVEEDEDQDLGEHELEEHDLSAHDMTKQDLSELDMAESGSCERDGDENRGENITGTLEQPEQALPPVSTLSRAPESDALVPTNDDDTTAKTTPEESDNMLDEAPEVSTLETKDDTPEQASNTVPVDPLSNDVEHCPANDIAQDDVPSVPDEAPGIPVEVPSILVDPPTIPVDPPRSEILSESRGIAEQWRLEQSLGKSSTIISVSRPDGSTESMVVSYDTSRSPRDDIGQNLVTIESSIQDQKHAVSPGAVEAAFDIDESLVKEPVVPTESHPSMSEDDASFYTTASLIDQPSDGSTATSSMVHPTIPSPTSSTCTESSLTLLTATGATKTESKIESKHRRDHSSMLPRIDTSLPPLGPKHAAADAAVQQSPKREEEEDVGGNETVVASKVSRKGALFAKKIKSIANFQYNTAKKLGK